AIVRWRWPDGALEPAGAPDTVVSQLHASGGHSDKTFAIAPDGSLFVNIGAPSNACQVENRLPGSPGQDPCPLLEVSGGIWRFDATKLGQTQADGERWATGTRNIIAIAVDSSGQPWGVQHGRDHLALLWRATHPIYTDEKNAENPGEEMFRLERGADYGWPYCYHDRDLNMKVLAPEYGGDGQTQGRCATVDQPQTTYPAHWAPNAMVFNVSQAFPEKYRNGAFIAFHGSFDRAPLPQQGFNIVFQPFRDGLPTSSWEVFAEGFGGHRPAGVAIERDGSLIVTDDRRGRVYRIRKVEPEG
ncbi:MAG TPA: PQQ-dependent sugar dehydrogenase, partial [Thermomicrobiales bacterium]|nr:PQQ-dependent sugar dehydrogenase [Thermomicrobiales bacterium]